MADDIKPLPDFEDPPVDETFLSIQFSPLGLQVPQYGMYWLRVRDRYPKFQVHSPVGTVIEPDINSPKDKRTISIGFELVTSPNFRFWMIDESGNRLIQIQKDRFVHNWRRLEGTEIYPRYPSVRATMEKEWDRFCQFLKEEDLGVPQVNQCEVSYINHIEYDKGWKNYAELSQVIRTWAQPSQDAFLPEPESVNMQVHYRLCDNSGRLHVSMEPVIRGRDAKEVLQLSLVARGAPKSSSKQDIFAWFDTGREWVVRGFADFTTEALQKIWGRRDELSRHK